MRKLAKFEDIHAFALIMAEKLANGDDELINNFTTDYYLVARPLRQLGFEQSFEGNNQADTPITRVDIEQSFGREGIKRLPPKMRKVKALGDEIITTWRYHSHWAMEPMDEEDFNWFRNAFTLLAELTDGANEMNE